MSESERKELIEKVEVLKLEKKHSNPKRKTFFWIAPSLDYMPVRVMQDDKGKIYDSQLISIDTKG